MAFYLSKNFWLKLKFVWCPLAQMLSGVAVHFSVNECQPKFKTYLTAYCLIYADPLTYLPVEAFLNEP